MAYAKASRWLKRKRGNFLAKMTDLQVASLIVDESGPDFTSPTSCLLLGNFGLFNGISRQQVVEITRNSNLSKIQMPFNRNYSVVTFKNEDQSGDLFLRLVDQKSSYFEVLPFFLKSTPQFDSIKVEEAIIPDGLKIQQGFLTEDEEKLLLEFVAHSSQKQWHLPDFPATFLLERLKKLTGEESNVLVVGEFEPEDTILSFGDEIAVVNLSSPIELDCKSDVFLLLENRSVLIFAGQKCEYVVHGGRKWDFVVEKSDGSLLTVFKMPKFDDRQVVPKEGFSFNILSRQRRILLSFRRKSDEITLPDCQTLESKYVREVYDAVASEFSSTRHTPWPKVAEFVRSLPDGSLLADVGCGNGKYFAVNRAIFTLGSDFSENLLKLAVQTTSQCGVLVSDCCQLPFRSNSMDAAINIAVIHHLASEARRKVAVDEIVRILRPNGGRALIHVWAVEQNDKITGEASTYTSNRKKSGDQTSVSVNGVALPVHQPRTPFNPAHPDCFVPWKKDHVRFYHVFKQGELEELCAHLEGKVTFKNHYFDEGNWCLEFVKN